MSEQTVKTTKTQQAYRYRCRGELEDGEEDDEEDDDHNEEEEKEDGLSEAEGREKDVLEDVPEEDA